MPRRTTPDSALGADYRLAPYLGIKQAIVTGQLAPGEPLVELTLAGTYETSRTPIREALIRLEQDGLVVRGPHGLRVREITPEQILDLYDARITLESKAAAVAAERRTDNDLLLMRRTAERANREQSDARALGAANREFHRAVAGASHNETLIDLLERMNMQLGTYAITTLAYPGRHEVASEQHDALIAAIERRDAVEAGRLAAEHFNDARNIRMKMFIEG
ncbi:GntR family transcriptional regulator [Streptosporangium sp. NPDC051022]|uniref:GntR family transcriptional regulator n=1 Tax=Streptosporangium sp. NPDC051022 TaxID=3155752 RepID=UPI00341D3995